MIELLMKSLVEEKNLVVRSGLQYKEGENVGRGRNFQSGLDNSVELRWRNGATRLEVGTSTPYCQKRANRTSK